MNSQKKMGFWSVTSLVAGSQIGSGIFLLPASLALFGSMGLISWFITGTGALLLALVFARLCAEIPKTGGPHAYIEAAFGKKIGFYAAWTYWVISWMSTPIVVVSVVGYLTPIWGDLGPTLTLILEISILLLITALNLLGVSIAGRAEFVFTVLKLLPLLLVPVAGLFLIKLEHFIPLNPTGNSNLHTLNAAALLTLWGFIGVESATAPAGSVQNARKTIPRAIITGTLIVAFVYVMSSFVIMGVMKPEDLSQSKAPFADAASLIFGGNWYLIISIAASIVCLGTLNAWVLTSGQIALGAANDGHLPKFFSIKNKRGAPIIGLIISSLSMIPILILTLDPDLIAQVNKIIDVSVTAFLFIYILAVLSYLKLFWKKTKQTKSNLLQVLEIRSILIAGGALLFCSWALWSSGIKIVGFALFIPLLGFPVYLWQNRRSPKTQQANPDLTIDMNLNSETSKNYS